MKLLVTAALVFACSTVGQAGQRQNCEAMKKNLASLKGDLAASREELASLRGRLGSADRAVQRISDTLKSYLNGEYQSALLTDTFREDKREQILQNLRKTTGARQNLKKAIDSLDQVSRGLKDSIDDLIQELSDCGGKARADEKAS
jgi:septal ring factor EnvC (AmiA/AmiB activator)